jgi:hypothetical protein
MCSDGLVGDIQRAPFNNANKSFEVDVILDHGSIEILADGGSISISALLAGSPIDLQATTF